MVTEIKSESERKAEYFYYSPWWITSRTKFSIPAGYTWIRIYYFDEWDTFKDKWWKAWYLVDGGNFEVPKYLREEYYIPTNWKEYCSPGVHIEDTALMYIAFMEDDYNQETSVTGRTCSFFSTISACALKER
nr:hypothetical transcript [Hymenolepis microstoma]